MTVFIYVCWGRASRSSEHLQMQHNYIISYRHGGVYMGIRIKRKRFLHHQNQLNLCFSYRLKSCCLHELFTSNAGISPVSKVKPYKRTTRVFIPAWSVWYGYQTSDTVLGCVYVQRAPVYVSQRHESIFVKNWPNGAYWTRLQNRVSDFQWIC